VPAYNAGKRIELTLPSIAAQDSENIEIIVVDDGSADDTCDAAEGLIKTLNVSAMRHDEAKFYQPLYDPETRRALLASHRYFFQKPEVFIKATFLLIAPRIYFRKRSKP